MTTMITGILIATTLFGHNCQASLDDLASKAPVSTECAYAEQMASYYRSDAQSIKNHISSIRVPDVSVGLSTADSALATIDATNKSIDQLLDTCYPVDLDRLAELTDDKHMECYQAIADYVELNGALDENFTFSW